MKNIDEFLESTFNPYIKKHKTNLKKRPSSSLPPAPQPTKEKPHFSTVSEKNIYKSLSLSKDSGATKQKVVQELVALSDNPGSLQESLKLKEFQLEKFHKEKQYSKRERIQQKLSHKELKARGIFHLPKNTKMNYKDYEAMTQLWSEYILGLLGPKQEQQIIRVDPMQACQKMVKADYHGAPLQVYNSKNEECIGIKGIVLQETLRLFVVLTKENKVKSKIQPGELEILKANSVFAVKLPDSIRSFDNPEAPLYLKLFGDHLIYRPSERTKVKFKEKHIMALI